MEAWFVKSQKRYLQRIEQHNPGPAPIQFKTIKQMEESISLWCEKRQKNY